MSGGESFTSLEVMDATGLTYRQVDHWTRMGWLHTTDLGDDRHGSGYWRAFPRTEVRVARLMAAMVDAGLAVAVAADAARRATVSDDDRWHVTLWGGLSLSGRLPERR